MRSHGKILPAICVLACLAMSPAAHGQFCPTALELEVVTLINQERQAMGLNAVAVDARLVEAARLHSIDMATNDFLSHTGSDGSTFSERILAAGYPTPRSENIAGGYNTAAAVVAAWMNSSGHRANLLDGSALHVGVGYAFDGSSNYGAYWTNTFGRASGAPLVPTACGGGGSADTTPPVAAITSLLDGAVVSGSISIVATASDNIAVAGVQFLVDGQALGAEDTLPPYAVLLDSTLLADGPHTISARARDGAGNQAVSAPLTVNVSNSDPGDPPQTPEPQTSTGPGTIDLTIELSDPGFRRVRAETESRNPGHLALYIDGTLTTTVAGDVLVFEWDVRPLLGSYEVRVDRLDASESEVLASTSLFYPVTGTGTPSVSLDVVDFRIIGATFIRGIASVGDLSRLEVYVNRDLVASSGPSDRIEFAWDPVDGEAYEILFVAYNSTGVAASVSIIHVQ